MCTHTYFCVPWLQIAQPHNYIITISVKGGESEAYFSLLVKKIMYNKLAFVFSLLMNCIYAA